MFLAQNFLSWYIATYGYDIIDEISRPRLLYLNYYAHLHDD